MQVTPKNDEDDVYPSDALVYSLAPASVTLKDEEPVPELSYDEGSSIFMLVLLSGPRLALQMAWAAQWAALTPYLQILLPKYAVNLTQFIGPVTGILVAPTVGVYSDTCTSKYGRRRPFLVFGAVTSAICWTLMGFTREFGEMLGDAGNNRTWTAIFTVFFYLWMDITVNIVSTPAYLILADFAGERQTTAAAIGQAAATLGALLVAAFIEIWGPASQHLHTFLALLSGVMLVTVGIVCIVAKEKVYEDTTGTTTSRRMKNAFSSIYTGVKTLPTQLAVFAAIYFCIQYGYTSYNGAKGMFFGISVYGGDPELADTCGTNCTAEQEAYNKGVRLAGGVTDLIFNSVGYVYSWTIPLLVSAFGMKVVLAVSIIPQTLLMVMAFSKVVELNMAIVVLTSITKNTASGLLVPVIVHVLGSATDDRMGLYLGAMTSANCAGQFMNFFLSSIIVNTSMGYALPVLVGGAVSLVGVVICLIFFKIRAKTL